MPWSTSRPASDRSKYGADHRRIRAQLLAQLKHDGAGRCCIGGEVIYAEQTALPRTHPRAIVLDHTADARGYRGLACRQHNVSDGAVRGRARQTSSPLRW